MKFFNYDTVKIFESKKRSSEDIDIRAIFDFDNISDEELEKQYQDLSFIVSSSGYGGHFMGAKGRILKEEATETLSVEETMREIQLKFNFKDWQLATTSVANKIQLVILYPGILKNTKLIKDAMSACGWSLSTKGFIVRNFMIWKAMSFDPMFQEDVSSEARKYKKMYHWTPLYNYDSIKNIGLIPKSENLLFDYPDRIHLIKGNTPTELKLSLGKQLCDANKRLKNKGDYILLEINLSKISKGTGIYYDPRYEWGYYMKTPIEPEAIKAIFGYNFKNDKQISFS